MRPTRPIFLAVGALLFGPVGGILLADPPGVDSPTSPRWIWRVGTRQDFTYHARSAAKPRTEGQGSPGVVDTAIEFHWTVKSVSEDGIADLAVRLDAVKASIESGGVKASFDSRNPDRTEPSGRLLARVYGVALNEEARLRIDARGQILEVRVAEPLARAVAQSPFSGLADSGSVLSEAGWKSLLGVLIPPIPEAPIAQGLERARSVTLAVEPTSMTLRLKDRVKSLDGGLLRVEVRGDVEARAGVTQGVSLKVQESSVEGEFVLDGQKGQLQKSTLRQRLILDLGIDGRTTGQSVEVQSSLAAKPMDAPKGEPK